MVLIFHSLFCRDKKLLKTEWPSLFPPFALTWLPHPTRLLPLPAHLIPLLSQVFTPLSSPTVDDCENDVGEDYDDNLALYPYGCEKDRRESVNTYSYNNHKWLKLYRWLDDVILTFNY